MISIVVPVYNVEKYLDRCVSSLVDQSYKDIEIILVDDGSSDSSGSICDKWAEKDDRIKVRHQENSGVSVTRNVALEIASGEFIAFVDADDYIDKDMLLKLISAMDDNTDMTVCGFKTVYEGASDSVSCDSLQTVDKQKAIRNIISNDAWGLVIWNKLIRRSAVYSENGKAVLFCKDFFIGEDALWILMVCNNCRKVSYVPEALYYYIKRQGSAVFKSKRERLIESCISRYDSALRGYDFLVDAGNPYAYMMFRRCVFSARDIACECYFKGKDDSYYDWMKKFFSALRNYNKMTRKSEDKMFILKNYLLYYSMRLHMPISLVRRLLNIK